jgi:low temperature requirement protein LtrA
LFTIIVLGECVLAATTAIQAALVSAGVSGALIAVSIGGLLLVFAMWWSYFKMPAAIGQLRELRWQIAWGYGHYFIFAAVAALGAGLQVAADAVTDPAHLPAIPAALTVAVPTAIYLIGIAVLHRRRRSWRDMSRLAIAALLVVAMALTAGVLGVPIAVLGIGVLVGCVVAVNVVAGRAPRAGGHASPV